MLDLRLNQDQSLSIETPSGDVEVHVRDSPRDERSDH